jgi:hypothetical protein
MQDQWVDGISQATYSPLRSSRRCRAVRRLHPYLLALSSSCCVCASQSFLPFSLPVLLFYFRRLRPPAFPRCFFSFFQLTAHYLNECSLSFNFVNFSCYYLSLFFVSGVCVFVRGLFLLFSSMTIYNYSDTVFLLFSDSNNY